MNERQIPSLSNYFQTRAIRWSLISFFVTVSVVLPCLLYAQKKSSERQIQTLARAAAMAFRSMILEGNVRNAEIQMQAALDLKEGELVKVRDPNLKAIYNLENETMIRPGCPRVESFCWAKNYRSLNVLYPIFFDELERKNIYGYLDLSIKPTVDYSVLSIFLISMLVTFAGQAIGLSAVFKKVASQLSHKLNSWADHLNDSPSTPLLAEVAIPFTELAAMKTAVDNLHLKIEELQDDAANEAKNMAHISLLRGIGHDLRTPHSQLAKRFALLIDTVKTTGILDPFEIVKVQETLKRMGDVIRQVRTLLIDQGAADLQKSATCISEEIENYFSDLKLDCEVTKNNITISLENTETPLFAVIDKLEFYRLVENLVRNSIAAVQINPVKDIQMALNLHNGRPTLIVKDNGCGIPLEIQKQIFDFNFTTRPARGTGLGLGIVKHICKQFHAELTFTSEVEIGSEFQISFLPVVHGQSVLEEKYG